MIPGTACPLENSPIEHDLENPVIIEETNLGNQTQVFEETADYNKTATEDCLVVENTCCAFLNVWPDGGRSTEIVPEPNCSDDIPNSTEIVPEPNCSGDIPNSTEIVPEPNCYDEIPNSIEIVLEPNCSDETPNSTEIVPEPNCSDEIPTSTEIVPEPNCSDEIPHSQQVSASTCSDRITNPLQFLKPDRSGENVHSPHKQGQSYMNIYTNSQELSAPPGVDQITASKVSSVTGMYEPLGILHHDITTRYQQILSDCRHESIWPFLTTDESPPNVDFPAHHSFNTDNIFSSHSSFKHNQDTHMHNPDQAAHKLYPISISSQQDLHTEYKGVVSDTNLTERSLATEQPLCFSVSLPEISDRPGLATLKQEEVTPPAMTDDTNLPWISPETAIANHWSIPSLC